MALAAGRVQDASVAGARRLGATGLGGQAHEGVLPGHADLVLIDQISHFLSL